MLSNSPERPNPTCRSVARFGAGAWVLLIAACGGSGGTMSNSEVPAARTDTMAVAAPATDVAEVQPFVGWVAGHQSGDGRWEAADWDRWRMGEHHAGERLPGLGSPSLDVAVTSLALMAYSGAGYTAESEGVNGPVVAWGLHALCMLQDEDGAFGDSRDANWPVNQGLAILALTEQAELCPESRLVEAVRRGVERAHRSRAVEIDRWTSDRVFGGLPPFAWLALASRLAVQSARSAQPEGGGASATGLESDTKLAGDRAEVAAWVSLPEAERTLAKVGAALTIGYSGREGRKEWQDMPVVIAAANWLADRAPEWKSSGEGVDAMGWWLGTQGSFVAGRAPYQRWERAMRTAIVESQRKDGTYCDVKGSWDPVGAGAEEGGRVFMTVTLSLAMQIWYRYDKCFCGCEATSVTQHLAAPKPKLPAEGRPLPSRRYRPCR